MFRQTCTVVIFRVKVISITSFDDIKLSKLSGDFFFVDCHQNCDVIGCEDYKRP